MVYLTRAVIEIRFDIRLIKTNRQRRFLAITCTKHLCDGLRDQPPNLFEGPLLKRILLLVLDEHLKNF